MLEKSGICRSRLHAFGLQGSAKTWCAKPGIVVSFNAATASAEILGALAPRAGE